MSRLASAAPRLAYPFLSFFFFLRSFSSARFYAASSISCLLSSFSLLAASAFLAWIALSFFLDGGALISILPWVISLYAKLGLACTYLLLSTPAGTDRDFLCLQWLCCIQLLHSGSESKLSSTASDWLIELEKQEGQHLIYCHRSKHVNRLIKKTYLIARKNSHWCRIAPR